MVRWIKSGFPYTMLKTQYRMHPTIASTTSKLFYEGNLKNSPNVHIRPADFIFKRFVRTFSQPLGDRQSLFLSVPNTILLKQKKGGSRINLAFLETVHVVFNKLLTIGARLEDIAVLTFYKGQLRLYDSLLPPKSNVLTVDSAQGKEWNFVILDVVTPGGPNHTLGFLTDVRRINVALSRAKSGLVIVGDQSMTQNQHPAQGVKKWTAVVQDHLQSNSLVIIDQTGSSVEEVLVKKGFIRNAYEEDRKP